MQRPYANRGMRSLNLPDYQGFTELYHLGNLFSRMSAEGRTQKHRIPFSATIYAEADAQNQKSKSKAGWHGKSLSLPGKLVKMGCELLLNPLIL